MRLVDCFRNCNKQDYVGTTAGIHPQFRTRQEYSPPSVDSICVIWGSYYDIPKAIFYLLKGDYRLKAF